MLRLLACATALAVIGIGVQLNANVKVIPPAAQTTASVTAFDTSASSAIPANIEHGVNKVNSVITSSVIESKETVKANEHGVAGLNTGQENANGGSNLILPNINGAMQNKTAAAYSINTATGNVTPNSNSSSVSGITIATGDFADNRIDNANTTGAENQGAINSATGNANGGSNLILPNIGSMQNNTAAAYIINTATGNNATSKSNSSSVSGITIATGDFADNRINTADTEANRNVTLMG